MMYQRENSSSLLLFHWHDNLAGAQGYNSEISTVCNHSQKLKRRLT